MMIFNGFYLEKDLMAMKIERISDNQIKFILTETDLNERNIRVNELKYGSEKTQELFREIMERATVECDFHTTQETPLIIEAIPISRDGIMIIVTRVSGQEDLEDRLGYPPFLGDYKNIPKSKPKKKMPEIPPDFGIFDKRPPQKSFLGHPRQMIFEFSSLDIATKACARMYGSYLGDNALYKYSGKYYLVLETEGYMISVGQENVLKEYGAKLFGSEISKTFLLERGEVVVGFDAISVLTAYLG